ncbi:Undecaprenyl-diphosphatase [Buchnera aphidicola (Neophyllaphis podocarpi)]|uniref:undecaprenyl-diphosphate phosphatase n=1 Tax=Buchnera aphidicola TaxID=9 RepID=UPI003463C696
MNNVNIIIILLSIIESFTEFLPISSTGHIIIISKILKINEFYINLFTIPIQIGSAIAIINYFKKYIFKKNIFSKNYRKFISNTVITNIPSIIIGFTLEKVIKKNITNNKFIIYSSILSGILLFLLGIIKNKEKIKNINEITYKHAITIGIFQCLAFFTGFSRLGAAISGSILAGLSKTIAIKFSLIIAIPIIIGASIIDYIKNINFFNIKNTEILFVGLILTFLISKILIKKSEKILTKNSFIIFGIYKIIFGLLIYIFSK